MKLLLRSMCILSFLALALPACKTSDDSDEKALPIENIGSLTLEQWTTACKAELAKPGIQGEEARADLDALVGAQDCAKAYKVINELIAALRKLG